MLVVLRIRSAATHIQCHMRIWHGVVIFPIVPFSSTIPGKSMIPDPYSTYIVATTNIIPEQNKQVYTTACDGTIVMTIYAYIPIILKLATCGFTNNYYHLSP